MVDGGSKKKMILYPALDEAQIIKKRSKSSIFSVIPLIRAICSPTVQMSIWKNPTTPTDWELLSNIKIYFPVSRLESLIAVSFVLGTLLLVVDVTNCLKLYPHVFVIFLYQFCNLVQVVTCIPQHFLCFLTVSLIAKFAECPQQFMQGPTVSLHSLSLFVQSCRQTHQNQPLSLCNSYRSIVLAPSSEEYLLYILYIDFNIRNKSSLHSVL